MEKVIQVKISLDEKSSFETKEGKQDITDEVFDAMTEAMQMAISDTLDFDDDDFSNSVMENYTQTLPDDFEGFKKLGFKIEVK